MSGHQHQIAELERQLAECELSGSLSAAPEARLNSKKRSDELRARLRELRAGAGAQ
jgi:hypothetical protein